MVAAAPALAIETRGLVRRFGDVLAVAGLDLAVPARGVYGFLGPNGAGKTTTIRILLGLVSPSAGGASVLGEPVHPSARVLDRVGALVERPAFYPYLSAFDNLRLFALARGVAAGTARERALEVLDRVGLAGVAGRRVRGFSTGMRQRLGIGSTLLGRPDLIVLDEPTSGLDPGGIVDVRELIASIARDGTAVFLSSHLLAEVEQVCDRVAILRRGSIVAEGITESLLRKRERLVVRFDAADDAIRAQALLAPSVGGQPGQGPGDSAALIVDAAGVTGSQVIRLLASSGVYPAEVRLDRPSLEAVFLELTAEAAPVPDPAEASGR